MTGPIVVVAAVIEHDGKFLISRRLAGTHLAGFWEFPGGKVDAGETREAALAREVTEELGCGIIGLREVFHASHVYPDRTVDLHFYRGDLDGPPRPVMGQELRWIARHEFATLAFPPADNELIAAIIDNRC